LSSSKCKGLLNNRKKPAKLMWTQAWRRLHKKGKEEGIARKKARRIVKVARAIVGDSLDEINQKQAAAKSQQKLNAATEAALKEAKDRAKAGAGGKAGPGVKTTLGHIQKYVPKHQKTSANFNPRGGAKR
jgi:large subunit ribosomal protein L24e